MLIELYLCSTAKNQHNMYKVFFLLATVIGVTSCSSNNDKSIEDLIASASDTTNPINITPGKVDSQSNVTNNLPANTSTTTLTSTGVNPAHGEPGHRCELAVGAPLNTAPAPSNAAKTPAGNINNVKITPAATPAKTQTKAGINPAHGEPGHRCDIAVGAPLSSTPAANTTTPVTTPAVSPTPPVYTPTTINTENKSANTPFNTVKLPEAKTDGNVKLNPAHGEPGHDCSIAVGQPLKKQ
jgi:hypothetical protein